MTAETPYGFEWGPMTVTRLVEDPRFGYVLEVSCGDRKVEIRCSPKGRRMQIDRAR